MMKCLIALLSSFVVSVQIMPILINLLKKKNYGQTILKYVEEHKAKNGTPTMGGLVFVFTTLILVFIFLKFDLMWFMCYAVSLSFAVLGFMDDHIKIKYKQNLGLRAYQKIVGQVGISIIFALFVYFYNRNGEIFLPFTTKIVDIKFWIVPLVILVLLATTNAVNLTDGIDGLAGSVSFLYLIIFVLINSFVYAMLYNSGETGQILTNFANVNILCMLFAGSILGFLMFNTNKASIFMGDVGSLCLGGVIATTAIATGQVLILPILGFCFVFSTVSVIMQVISFKLTKRRIFKMAPFHHHLQMSGFNEARIVAIYSAVTIMLGVLSLILYLL